MTGRCLSDFVGSFALHKIGCRDAAVAYSTSHKERRLGRLAHWTMLRFMMHPNIQYFLGNMQARTAASQAQSAAVRMSELSCAFSV